VVCLGAFAWDVALRIFEFSPKPKFTHGAEATAGAVTLLGCYHPSQQNTFTGVLTPAMLDAALQRARSLAARR
jgi:uracil-DNA glycosylase